jgi:flagellar hook-associated protein 2
MSSIGNLTGGASGSVTGQLDVQWIVEQIIYAKQQPIRDLETFEIFYEAKKEAFQELNTRVSALESSIYTMNTSGFDSKSAAVSTDTYFTASASTSANAGSYSIVVDQLAAAQSETSADLNITDPNDQDLTDGKVTIRNYDDTSTLGEVDFTGSTMSLNGLKDAINSLGLDITATVVNFGTEDNADYRIQLTADNTGVENGFTINESGGGTIPAFDTKIAAADAQVYVNVNPATDPNDYITRSSNTITDVISGVTLNLKEADDTKTTTLTIASDSANFKENVQDFVTKFNDVMDYLNAQFTYNEEKEAAGVLSGESGALKVKQDLLKFATSRVEGIGSGSEYNSFAVIGLEINQSGQLEINDTRLDEAIENDLDGVKRVLRDSGSGSHNEITFVGSSDDTVAGTYDVHIDTAAEQAIAEGVANIAATLGQDEILTITYQGNDYTVNLTSGMDNSTVVSTINSAMDDNEISLFSRVNSSGNLEIATDAYGSSKSITVKSDVASGGGGTGIGTTDVTDTGVDVAGTIDSNAASGSGQLLTGAAGKTKGLMINVATTSIQGGSGDDKGTIYFTRGVAEGLRDRMFELSFPYSGLLAKNIESFENKLENIEDKIKDINRQLSSEQEILIMQFTKANEALAQMTYLKSTLSNNFAGA